MNPWQRCFEGLVRHARRSARRKYSPAIVAHYWSGGAPCGRMVRDVSATGFYMRTEERWYPGTLVFVTLQRTEMETGEESAIAVLSRVVRADSEGVGFAFVLPPGKDPGVCETQPLRGADRGRLRRFLKSLRASSGQALVEYILVLPLVLILIVNVINFAGFFYAWITVANAARAGADYYIMGGATVRDPLTAVPSATGVANLITADVASLPNQASVVVNICQNTNGTVTTVSGTCTSIASDPEPASYTLTTIDVAYTYQPFIPASFQFPGLHVFATLPPTTIHQRGVMREEGGH